MFENGTNAGSTVLVGLGDPTPGTETDGERHQAELRERNEEYIAVEVRFPRDTYDGIEPPSDVYLGDADQFVVHDDQDAVPRRPGHGVAPRGRRRARQPRRDGFRNPHEARMYVRTEEVDRSEADGE